MLTGFLTNEQKVFLRSTAKNVRMNDEIYLLQFVAANSSQSNGRGGIVTVGGNSVNGSYSERMGPYKAAIQEGADLYGFGDRLEKSDERDIGNIVTVYDCPVKEADKVVYKNLETGQEVEYEVSAVNRFTNNFTTVIRVSRQA